MKPSTRRKTLLAVVMTLIMSLAFAGTAFAAGPKTITVDGNTKGHTYGAYQILRGDVEKNAEGNNVLTNVGWADGVDGKNLVLALQKNTDLKDIFADVDVNQERYIEKFMDALGKIASESDEAYTFAEVVKPYLGNNPAILNGNPPSANVEEGYYLIADTAELPEGITATSYILNVTDSVKVQSKSGTVTSDKDVIEDSKDAYKKFADAEVNQVVSFRLTGTLPENIDKYETYWMSFVDELSNGLTYIAGSLKVYYYNGDSANRPATPEDMAKLEQITGFEPVVSPNGFELRLESDEKLQIDGKQLTKDTVIYVTYDARVNEKAIVGDEGNPNTFHLEYKNNPNKDRDGDKGSTPPTTVIVYTWELDNTKIDPDSGITLRDATFQLFRENGDVREFAVLIPAVDKDGKAIDNTWEIAKDSNGTQLWLKEGEAIPTDAPADATLSITTTENGIFNIQGLDSGDEYWLIETKAPEGYNLLKDPIKVVINAQFGEKNDYSAAPTKLELNDVENSGDVKTGIVAQNIENKQGTGLPSTGGMGTIIFTVVGIAVMVVAAVVFVTRRRRSANLA